MKTEHYTEGYNRALDFYESIKKLNVFDKDYPNGRQRNTFLSAEYGFQISWPNGWEVDVSRAEFYKTQLSISENLRVLVALIPQSLFGGFRPVVTVSVEENLHTDLDSYTRTRFDENDLDIFEIIRTIGVNFGSAMSSFNLRPFKGPSHERIFRFHKVILKNEKAYIVTAMQVAENALVRNDRLFDDLERIVNSFSIWKL